MPSPLQVFLDDQDHQRLSAWATARGWTKSQAVRVAIRALTQSRAEDPLLAASGMIDALPRDLSVQIDRYLEETYVAPPATGARQRSERKRRIRR
jgi:hypothetical protein